MQAIEERWGLFLKHVDFKNENALELKFNDFKEKILQGYENNDVIENPAYYIRLGNALIDHANSYKTRILNALGLSKLLFKGISFSSVSD